MRMSQAHDSNDIFDNGILISAQGSAETCTVHDIRMWTCRYRIEFHPRMWMGGVFILLIQE
eukprot:m.161926 g.161926  ORF g.161926 m.161926 type:complete len:61 (-) comp18063_c0_seq3:8-190(-)